MQKWLKASPSGLYCVPGDFYIDPVKPVESAIVTHAHADHVAIGSSKILATPITCQIIELRHQESAKTFILQNLPYHTKLKIKGVSVELLPAGHITGSAQILMEYAGARIIVSGDYKRRFDPTCSAFEVRNCDLFITESTFALPIFVHPPINDEIKRLLSSITEFSSDTHLIGVYTLGKAQRIIMTLRSLGYEKPIYIHGALNRLCEFYRSLGFDLGKIYLVTPENAAELTGEIVLCPPGSLHDRWTRRLTNVRTGLASGWMRTRARAKQKHIELPLVISDHADWPELLQTVTDMNAPDVWVMHGDEESLVHQLQIQGYNAMALPHAYRDKFAEDD